MDNSLDGEHSHLSVVYRAARLRRLLTAIVLATVVFSFVIPALRTSPQSLDVTALPVRHAAVGGSIALANPLDPELKSATVTAIQSSGAVVVATIQVCAKGEWAANGVTGFSLEVAHGAPILPDQDSSLLSLDTSTCAVGDLQFTVARTTTVRGLRYDQIPYVVAEWTLRHPLRVAPLS